MKWKLNFLLYYLIWASIIFMAPRSSLAQQSSGTWHRAYLPTGSNNTLDFNFVDSLNGLCVSDGGYICSTSNGGRSWSLDTNLGNYSIQKDNLNALECVASHRGFFHGIEENLAIIPGYDSFSFPPELNEVNYGAYFTLAEKMYDTAYGFRLVELLSPYDARQFNDSLLIIVTHDGWASSTQYGIGYLLSPDTTYANLHSRPMTAGSIVDSNDIWTSAVWKDVPYNQVIHTSNGGATWETLSILGNRTSSSQVKDLIVHPKIREVYYFGNFNAVDFAYSSDYGVSWRIDSSFGNRLWRLANPAPGILWGIISAGGIPVWESQPTDTKNGPAFANEYASKLAYSSDNGETWSIDSTTFINDSLLEMHWLDGRHGWIATWSHDSLWMWYYDADGSSCVQQSCNTYFPPMVYPDPSTGTVLLNYPGMRDEVEVFDVIGREVLRAPVPLSGGPITLDIRSLTPGPYFIRSGTYSSRFLKE